MASPLSSIAELMAPSLSPEDLDFELGPGDRKTFEEFEDAWKKFMLERPDLVPVGRRERRIEELQKEVREFRQAQNDLNEELTKQLEFFDRTLGELEDSYGKEIESVKEELQKVHESFKLRHDDIRASEHILGQSFMWNHYQNCLNEAVKEAQQGHHDKKANPSAKAMFLTDSGNKNEGDALLSGFAVDHALLSMHITMLNREAKAYDKLAATRQYLGEFLTQQNVCVGDGSSLSSSVHKVE